MSFTECCIFYCCAGCSSTQLHIFIMLSVILLNVDMLGVAFLNVMLSVAPLRIVILSVAFLL